MTRLAIVVLFLMVPALASALAQSNDEPQAFAQAFSATIPMLADANLAAPEFRLVTCQSSSAGLCMNQMGEAVVYGPRHIAGQSVLAFRIIRPEDAGVNLWITLSTQAYQPQDAPLGGTPGRAASEWNISAEVIPGVPRGHISGISAGSVGPVNVEIPRGPQRVFEIRVTIDHQPLVAGPELVTPLNDAVTGNGTNAAGVVLRAKSIAPGTLLSTQTRSVWSGFDGIALTNRSVSAPAYLANSGWKTMRAVVPVHESEGVVDQHAASADIVRERHRGDGRGSFPFDEASEVSHFVEWYASLDNRSEPLALDLQTSRWTAPVTRANESLDALMIAAGLVSCAAIVGSQRSQRRRYWPALAGLAGVWLTGLVFVPPWTDIGSRPWTVALAWAVWGGPVLAALAAVGTRRGETASRPATAKGPLPAKADVRST